MDIDKFRLSVFLLHDQTVTGLLAQIYFKWLAFIFMVFHISVFLLF